MADRIQTCSCGARIVFRFNAKSGKPSPILADPTPDGNVAINPDGRFRILGKGEVYDGPRYKSHFADCPSAPAFRRKGK
jgi:hypothetical protein